MSNVFVRAKTSDERWASVDAVELDERSFREFVLGVLAEYGMVSAIPGERTAFSTPLTKAQAEREC